jgi:hypothetical protein
VSKKSVYPSALRYFNAEGVVEQRPGLAAFFAANPGISVRKPAKGLRTELGTQPFQGPRWGRQTFSTPSSSSQHQEIVPRFSAALGPSLFKTAPPGTGVNKVAPKSAATIENA